MSAVESWALYAVGVSSTFLRFYARVRVGGLKNLAPEDYLMAVAIVFYTVQTTLAYNIGIAAHGLGNNGMTDAERAALFPDDPEYKFRVVGSKIQVAGWSVYSAMIWTLKLSMLFFYTRLTNGLQQYRIRIQIGFLLVLASFLAVLFTIFAGCRPFQKYWQINPDPGNVCEAGISKPIVWVSFTANVSTDIYLIAIPLPMLWQSQLKLIKKVASTIILGAGIFVVVCAILKSVFVLVDPIHGGELAGSWGTRETFVAVMTTNLPFIFPLLRIWLAPLFTGLLGSTKQSYQTPTGFRTIGGGGGAGGRSRSRSRREPAHMTSISANISFSGSEERIVGGGDGHDLKVFPARGKKPSGIVITKNVVQVRQEAVSDDKKSQSSGRNHDAQEMW